MQEQMRRPAETGMERRGGPKHVHASRDRLAVVHVVQQRLRDVSEPQQLLWHRAEVEHEAYRHQLRVDGVDFDDVIYLRANMQHHLLHVRRTHARAHTRAQSRTRSLARVAPPREERPVFRTGKLRGSPVSSPPHRPQSKGSLDCTGRGRGVPCLGRQVSMVHEPHAQVRRVALI